MYYAFLTRQGLFTGVDKSPNLKNAIKRNNEPFGYGTTPSQKSKVCSWEIRIIPSQEWILKHGMSQARSGSFVHMAKKFILCGIGPYQTLFRFQTLDGVGPETFVFQGLHHQTNFSISKGS